MEKKVLHPLNPGEAKVLKAAAYDLSELAAKQALYGIIQVLSFKTRMSTDMLKEIIDDARKYSDLNKKPRKRSGAAHAALDFIGGKTP